MNSSNSLLDALTLRGVLLSVSIRYWRGRKKLNPEDLGLTQEQVNDRLISLGHKRLLPKEAFQRIALIEGRAHAHVENTTFPFLGGLAHYIPNEKLNDTLGTLRQYREEFEECRDRFLRDYETLRASALDDWGEMAEHLPVDRDRLLATVADSFPPREKIEGQFAFDIQTFHIAMPDSIPTTELIGLGTQQEVLEARRQAVNEARSEIEGSCREFIADCVASMREQTAKLCGEMLTSIETGGNVHQKTLNRLIKFIDRFRELNFANDAEMEAELQRVRAEFLTRSAQNYRSSNAARTKLVNGLQALRTKATEMASQDVTDLVDSFGQIGHRRFHLAA